MLVREMHSEFSELEKLGWIIPPLSTLGLFTPSLVDEDKISFPSESYDSADINSEAAGFWATERANAIAEMLESTGAKTLWEIGAGNGNAAIPLRDLGFSIIPVEPLKSGALTLAKNGFLTFHATLEGLNLPNSSIEAIGAFDVLEHLEKPEILLTEIYRVLKPGGVFICSVPAYQWLFSDFDISIGHYRRYSRRNLRRLLERVHLRPKETKSIFAFLVVPAFILRRIPYLFGRRANLHAISKSSGGNSKRVNKMAFVFSKVHKFEQALRLPIGLTLITKAVKPLD